MRTHLKQAAMMAAAVLGLSGCGPEKTPSTIFEKTSEECEGAAVKNRFVVHFTDGSTQSVEARSREDFLNGFVTENLEQIEYAEHDYFVKTHAAGALPAATTVSNWGPARIEADALWSQGMRGDGIAVAVVDSGMDLSHAQLAKQVFTNPGEQGVDQNGLDRASNGIDDDGNGLVDDAIGYDFNANRPLQGDYNYHGSHVAGIIAAQHADTQAGARTYVQGVAPGAKILPLAFLGETGDGLMSNGVRAIEYAARRGVKVINASWGGTMCSRSLRDSVARLEKRGVIFVAAAGNDSSDVDRYKEYPASLNLAAQITVGATGEQNYMAEYSNYGALAVHLFAPGSNIVSTVPGGMGSLSGTSMAAPMVSGSVALLLSAEPNANAAQIRQALMAATVKRNDYINASKGRLNLRAALAELRRLLNP